MDTNLKMVGDFKAPEFLKRYANNPVLSPKDIPYTCHLVFNCSVIERDGKYVMLFRNDFFPEYGNPHGTDTDFGVAESDDGIAWKSWPKPVFKLQTDEIRRVYDPRLIPLEGKYYMTCCASTRHGPRAATFEVSQDFTTFEMIDMSLPDSRNTVLFPEKIGGWYYRLERPFWGAMEANLNRTGQWIGQKFHTWISRSPDLIHWGSHKLLIDCNDVPYANVKIGPGAVPIRTEKGWLLLTHGVDYDPSRGKNGWEPFWRQRYHSGVALVDLEDPTKLLGFSRAPLITPEAPYEVDGGFRNNVVFPMAGIVKPDGNVMIYYGAADAHVCLATAPLDKLLEMCEAA